MVPVQKSRSNIEISHLRQYLYTLYTASYLENFVRDSSAHPITLSAHRSSQNPPPRFSQHQPLTQVNKARESKRRATMNRGRSLHNYWTKDLSAGASATPFPAPPLPSSNPPLPGPFSPSAFAWNSQNHSSPIRNSSILLISVPANNVCLSSFWVPASFFYFFVRFAGLSANSLRRRGLFARAEQPRAPPREGWRLMQLFLKIVGGFLETQLFLGIACRFPGMYGDTETRSVTVPFVIRRTRQLTINQDKLTNILWLLWLWQSISESFSSTDLCPQNVRRIPDLKNQQAKKNVKYYKSKINFWIKQIQDAVLLKMHKSERIFRW